MADKEALERLRLAFEALAPLVAEAAATLKKIGEDLAPVLVQLRELTWKDSES